MTDFMFVTYFYELKTFSVLYFTVKLLLLLLQLISANNIATYGSLCALATFDRQELQRLVISSRCVGRQLFTDIGILHLLATIH